MAKVKNGKPATVREVKEIMKEANSSLSEVILKQVKEIVMDASDTILNGVDVMFKEQDGRDEKKFTTKEDLKREVSWLRDDINGLKTDLSDIPTKKEFNELKGRVDKYHPVS